MIFLILTPPLALTWRCRVKYQLIEHIWSANYRPQFGKVVIIEKQLSDAQIFATVSILTGFSFQKFWWDHLLSPILFEFRVGVSKQSHFRGGDWGRLDDHFKGLGHSCRLNFIIYDKKGYKPLLSYHNFHHFIPSLV